jgi:large subunit ribosomal protein L18
MITKNRAGHRANIKTRIRKKIRGTTECPRLVVYRSLHHVYVQVVDDTQSKTILTTSSLSPDLRSQVKSVKGMKEVAKLVGRRIAEMAQEKNLKHVVFDRNGYIYHGIVKSLADAAREAGLSF